MNKNIFLRGIYLQFILRPTDDNRYVDLMLALAHVNVNR